MKKNVFYLVFFCAVAGCTPSRHAGDPAPEAAGFITSAHISWQPQMYAPAYKAATLKRARATGNAKIIASWKEKAANSHAYRKILVIGITGKDRIAVQEDLEMKFARNLKQSGYNAVYMSQEFGHGVFDRMDEAAIGKLLKDHGVDAVITVTLTDKGRIRNCVPGNIYSASHGYYYKRLWTYCAASRHRMDNQPQTDTRQYFLESNLYNIAAEKLIYSVQTRSFDVYNSESKRLEYGLEIVNDIQKEKIL